MRTMETQFKQQIRSEELKLAMMKESLKETLEGEGQAECKTHGIASIFPKQGQPADPGKAKHKDWSKKRHVNQPRVTLSVVYISPRMKRNGSFLFFANLCR